MKLVIDNVAKIFSIPGKKQIEAVRSTSFSVPENQYCVLLGPSGCGKSTVLRMVAGLEISDQWTSLA